MPKVSKVIRMRKDAKEQIKKDRYESAVKRIRDKFDKAAKNDSDHDSKKNDSDEYDI